VEGLNKIVVSENEIEISAIRAQGSGGQNVNKVSSAIHLRFDIRASSLPDIYKERLLKLNDQRITKEGVLVIKAQQHRSQEKNRGEALRRLYEFIDRVVKLPQKRKLTKPTHNSQIKRLNSKTQRGLLKIMRKKLWLNLGRNIILNPAVGQGGVCGFWGTGQGVTMRNGATAQGSACQKKVQLRSGMRGPSAVTASPPLPDPRFAGSLVRRFAPHSKELQRNHVPQKTCNPPRSVSLP
jgi:ribosome-associated protein